MRIRSEPDPQFSSRVQTSTNLIDWPQESAEVIGLGFPLSVAVVIPVENRIFYRLAIEPMSPPTSLPTNVNFFPEYGDFSFLKFTVQPLLTVKSMK